MVIDVDLNYLFSEGLPLFYEILKKVFFFGASCQVVEVVPKNEEKGLVKMLDFHRETFHLNGPVK